MTSAATGNVQVTDTTILVLVLDPSNPVSGWVGDSVTVGATLKDSDGNPMAQKAIVFTIGSVSGQATTDVNGHASTVLVLAGPSAGDVGLQASYAGVELYAPSNVSAGFMLNLLNIYLPQINR